MTEEPRSSDFGLLIIGTLLNRDAAAMFCSGCSIEDVPSTARVAGDHLSSQARATWVGAA